jgi:hypothetical protein
LAFPPLAKVPRSQDAEGGNGNPDRLMVKA